MIRKALSTLRRVVLVGLTVGPRGPPTRKPNARGPPRLGRGRWDVHGRRAPGEPWGDVPRTRVGV